MIWPKPYSAPNFTKKVVLPKIVKKPENIVKTNKPFLQQGDWSNLTSEPVAPFGLSPIVQGSKPIISKEQAVQTVNNTPVNMPKPAQLPATGAKKLDKNVLWELSANIAQWDDLETIRQKFPEVADLKDDVLWPLTANIAKWDSYETIVKKYPELWLSTPQTQSFKTATQTQKWWLLDYQIFWKLDPNKVENANVWWFAWNVLKSSVNMISDVGNMLTNPIWTAKWLAWMVTGAWVNAAKFLWKEFLGKSEEEMNAKLQGKIDKGWVIWMLASTVKWAENIADNAWEWAVVNRYWSLENAKRTAYEDPIGFISDIATVVSWVGWAVKWWATSAAKLPKLAKSAWTLRKIADTAWDIQRVADYADPWNIAMKGYMKAWAWVAKWIKSIPGVIEWGVEKVATNLTKTATPQDKLFKAQEPRLNQLNKQVDYKKMRENSDIANQEIVNAWYKPTDTTTRAEAHKATMDKIWKEEIESKIWWMWNIDLTPVADKIDEFVAKAERAWIVTNEWQLNQLKAQSKRYREMWSVNWSDWEYAKQMLNAQINNFWDASIWDVYKNWLKEATKVLWKQLDDAFSAIPWEFADAKRRFWALKATYEDVFKSDLKSQRAKWEPLMQSYSRLEWAWDIVWWIAWMVTGKNPLPQLAQWWAKLLMGKVLWKIKDKDFLIQKWFQEIAKQEKPKNTSSPISTKKIKVPFSKMKKQELTNKPKLPIITNKNP